MSTVPAPILDLTFARHWRVQILPARPHILPARHFVYPQAAEEVERGALELLVAPAVHPVPTGSLSPMDFLATCALGFRDPVVPTGVWSCPNPNELCAVSGGYVYLIDTTAPQRFTMLPYRPVMQILPLPSEGLLLFVGHRSILAWGAHGQAWESEKLSDEGIALRGATPGILHGIGWHMITDKETLFALDLRNGTTIHPASV